jgi:hypothetical protein
MGKVCAVQSPKIKSVTANPMIAHAKTWDCSNAELLLNQPKRHRSYVWSQVLSP